MIRYAMLCAIVSVGGCGLARDTNTVPPLGVTFFGLDLSTQASLDIRRIELRDLPAMAECPGDVGTSPSATRRRYSSRELLELLKKHPGGASLPPAPSV